MFHYGTSVFYSVPDWNEINLLNLRLYIAFC
nr:MAG TPA: hypothetical protein [Caudoviricetes sp.]